MLTTAKAVVFSLGDLVANNSRLDPECAQRILDALRLGKNVQEACEAASISARSYHVWMQRGELGQPPFREFQSAVLEAKAAGARQKHADLLASLGLAPTA